MSNETASNEKFELAIMKCPDLQAMIDEELDGRISFSAFRRVKMPSGGGLAFEIATENPNKPEVVQTIKGVIVVSHSFKQYYREKTATPGKKPDCVSMDCKTGHGDPGGNCEECPKNVFIKGRGYECTSKKRLFIIRSGEYFPIYLDIPPTSLNNYDNYVTKLISMKMLRPCNVITEISLSKDTNAKGQTVSKVEFSRCGLLNDEENASITRYRKGFRSLTAKATQDNEEGYVADESEETYASQSNNLTVTTGGAMQPTQNTGRPDTPVMAKSEQVIETTGRVVTSKSVIEMDELPY